MNDRVEEYRALPRRHADTWIHREANPKNTPEWILKSIQEGIDPAKVLAAIRTIGSGNAAVH